MVKKLKQFIIYVIAVCALVAVFFIAKSSFTTSDQQLVKKAQKQNIIESSAKPVNHNYLLKTTPDKKTTYTNVTEAHFNGQVDSSSAQILINDQPIEIDEKGQFDAIFSMQPGENKFIFVYEDSQQGKREEKFFRWIMDTVEPAFQITKPLAGIDILLSKPEVDIAGEFILFDEKSKIEDGVKVEVNGAPLIISDDRRGFAGTIRLVDGKHELKVTAIDRAGNKAVKTFSVNVDSVPPVIHIEGYKVIREKGGSPLIRFNGTVSEPSALSFGPRPVAVDKTGEFQFEIYLADLAALKQKSTAIFQAQDKAGNIGRGDLPKDGDFIPPHWLKLTLVDGIGAEKVTLVGKVSEANVKVRIGNAEAISDSEGDLRIEDVTFNQDNPVVETVLRDEAGNESHIEQWVSIHAKEK